MGRLQYGRAFRRAKAAAWVPGLTCWLCGQELRWYGEYTLHHVEGQGGSPFQRLVPVHRRCNLQAAARKANETKRRRYGSAGFV